MNPFAFSGVDCACDCGWICGCGCGCGLDDGFDAVVWAVWWPSACVVPKGNEEVREGEVEAGDEGVGDVEGEKE